MAAALRQELFALDVAGLDPEPSYSWADAKAAWDANREYLIERAIAREPGQRPVAFWIFDAQRVDLLGDPDDWRTWDELRPARVAWVREHGELRHDELRAMTAEKAD